MTHQARTAWQWPLDPTQYDQTPTFRPTEWVALRRWHDSRNGSWSHHQTTQLHRLLQPMQDVVRVQQVGVKMQQTAVRAVLHEMYDFQRPFWGWTDAHWQTVLSSKHTTRHRLHDRADAHPHLLFWATCYVTLARS